MLPTKLSPRKREMTMIPWRFQEKSRIHVSDNEEGTQDKASSIFEDNFVPVIEERKNFCPPYQVSE